MDSIVHRDTCITPSPKKIIKKEKDSDDTGENSEQINLALFKPGLVRLDVHIWSILSCEESQ